jgi:uncharacterized protein YyaL (SSP411 family)
MRDYPAGFGAMAIALDEFLEPAKVLVLRGKSGPLTEWRNAMAREFLPAATVLAIPDGARGLPAPLDKPLRPEPVNGWLCRGVTCLPPISDLVNLQKTLKENA